MSTLLSAPQQSVSTMMDRYTLYYFQWSLWSLVARYAIALRGEPSAPEAAMEIGEKFIDIHNGDNLAEWYLVEVNPKGQVPTLVSPKLHSSITETLDITYLVCKSYPKLLPPAYSDIIKVLLFELKSIQPFSLCFPPPENRAEGSPNPYIEELLARPDISDTWRKALEYKLEFHNKTFLRALDEDPVEHAKSQAREFFARVLEQYKRDNRGGTWIFGDDIGATALDAHVIPWILRLVEVGRADLIPGELQKYAAKAAEGPAWQSVSMGGPTLGGLWLKEMKKKHEEQGIDEPFRQWVRKQYPGS